MLFRFYHPKDQSILFLYNDEIPQIIKKREDGQFQTIQFIFDRMNVADFFYCLIKGKCINIKSRYEALAIIDRKRIKLTKPYDSKRTVLKILGIDDKDLLIVNDKRNNQYIWSLSDEEMMISSEELNRILHPSEEKPFQYFENDSPAIKPHTVIHKEVDSTALDMPTISIKSVQNKSTGSRPTKINFDSSNGGFEEFERESTEKRKHFENKMTAFDQEFKRDKDKSKAEFEITEKRFSHELIEKKEEYRTPFKDEEDRYSQQQDSLDQIRGDISDKSKKILDGNKKMDREAIIDNIQSRSMKLEDSLSREKSHRQFTNTTDK